MKNKLLVLILSALLLITVGCSSTTTTYNVVDAVTGLPINGTVAINGKNVSIKNGIVSTKTKEVTIEKNGYENAKSNETKIVRLTPIAFLELNVKPIPEEIYVDGVKYPVFLKNNSIILSPFTTGNHKLTFKGNFIEEKSVNVQIAKGKNKISVSLLLNNEKAYSFLSKIKFPEEFKNIECTININGTVDNENMDYTFNAQVQDGKIITVSDKNISYKFKDNTPFIKDNDTLTQVKDRETVAALIYARDVLQNILKLREFIKPLKLTDISNSNASFIKQRTFENRPFSESITLYFNKDAVNKAIVNIKSPIENTDLFITIDIKTD